MKNLALSISVLAVSCISTSHASVLLYGTEDLLGTGTYPTDPTAGATLQGLAPDAVTFASSSFAHGYPFSPSSGDYPGTDQIYVGSTQTGAHDGYSTSDQRIAGPQVITFDYSTLVPVGQQVSTFTLGIATDDFQDAVYGQPFTASINGMVDAALTATLNSLDESGPITQFLTIGIDPAALQGNNILTLTIDEGGDGGDGWAVDFLTA
ncbi:MAG TPA: hypothetical protein VGN88_00140, partial [Phycisphaerae bacterium]